MSSFTLSYIIIIRDYSILKFNQILWNKYSFYFWLQILKFLMKVWIYLLLICVGILLLFLIHFAFSSLITNFITIIIIIYIVGILIYILMLIFLYFLCGKLALIRWIVSSLLGWIHFSNYLTTTTIKIYNTLMLVLLYIISVFFSVFRYFFIWNLVL